jgi:hypothetical protein
MKNRWPSVHNSMADVAERQRAVFRVLAGEPERRFTATEIYTALHYRFTRAEIRSAISCLRTRGLVELEAGDGHPTRGTYRLAELGLLECGAIGAAP